MKIQKQSDSSCTIKTPEEWFIHCPPQKGIKQWVAYRSAMEMAKYWTSDSKIEVFNNYISKFIDIGIFDIGIPEYESIFDEYKSGRMHDLLVLNKRNDIVVTIEGKADESFGSKTFSKELNDSLTEKIKNPASMKFDRMINLYSKYYSNNPSVFNIMYQLIHWYAGTLADSEKYKTNTMIMINQIFDSNKVNKRKMTKNNFDFYEFIKMISENKFSCLDTNTIIGPINNKYTNGKNLFLGKFVEKLP